MVTWFNPQAIIDGSMLLGASKSLYNNHDGLKFISGVATGSFIWFSTLAWLLPLIKQKFSPKILQTINLICGIIIGLYGLKLIYNFFNLILN